MNERANHLPPPPRTAVTGGNGNETERRGGGARSLLWGVAFVLMAVWSLLAWFGYMAADPLLVWLGSALGVVVESGQGVAEAFGGKPAGEVFGALNAGGAGAQILALASLILKPAIVVIWALGMVALAVLPTLASVAGRLLGRR